MGFSVISLAIICVAVLQAEALGDLKSENSHSTIQVTRSTVRDNSSLKKRQEILRNAHMNLQSNQIAGSVIRDQVQIQPKFPSQDIQTSTLSDQGSSQDQLLFQSTTLDSFPTTTISSVASGKIDINGELSYHKQQMNRNDQGNFESQGRFNGNSQSENHQRFFVNNQQNSEEQQFYNSRQQLPAEQQQHFSRRQQSQQHIFPSDRQSSPSEQQFYNMRQQAQQQQFNDPRNQQEELFNARQQSNGQQQQLFNAGQQSFEQQQQFNNAGQQSYQQQQQHFNAGQQHRMYNHMQTMDIDDQNINLNNQFQGLSIHQNRIRNERPLILSQNILTQMQSGVRKDAQLSAFDNREHGLTLPRGSSVQSSSVVVSGLKNLPMLPAMVYNAGPVPASHAIAYGRDGYYRGSAYLNHQMRTPYVRYVYSHIL